MMTNVVIKEYPDGHRLYRLLEVTSHGWVNKLWEALTNLRRVVSKSR
jgi:hypothetical protein